MTNCGCPATSLASLRFADGLVMVRCGAHESQTWFVDGRPVGRDKVLPALKDLFVDRRGERRGTPAPARSLVRLSEPVAHDAGPAEIGDSARLTALLRARGLSGTWAVA